MTDKKASRLRDIMPEYFDYADYKGYSIKMKPVGWRRAFPKWPYFVGSRISLSVEFRAVTNQANEYPLESFVLFENHPQNALLNRPKLKGILESGSIFTSDRISRPGDFIIYAGFTYGGDPNAPLFSASIIHKDILRYDIFLVGIGFLCTLAGIILAWLLGIIQIVPTWSVWIH